MIEQLPLTVHARLPSRKGEPVAAFVLHGDPQAWVRPSPFKRGAKVVQAWTGAFKAWRDRTIASLQAYWLGRGNLKPVRVPLIARVVAVFPRPARPPVYTIDGERVVYTDLFEWTPGRNFALVEEDVDNLAKALLDAAQRHDEGKPGGPLLGNDRWVVRLEVEKVYAALGEEPCTEVRLWRAA